MPFGQYLPDFLYENPNGFVLNGETNEIIGTVIVVGEFAMARYISGSNIGQDLHVILPSGKVVKAYRRKGVEWNICEDIPNE